MAIQKGAHGHGFDLAHADLPHRQTEGFQDDALGLKTKP
jgi:hypothetical protein